MKHVHTPFLTALLAALVVALIPLSGKAQETTRAQTPAMAFIDDLANEALDVLRVEFMVETKRREKLDELLQKGFAIDYIGRFIVGHHWRRASPLARDEYMPLAHDFMLDTLVERLSLFNDESFVVLAEKPAGKRDIYVETEIRPNSGPPALIEWRVRDFGGSEGLRIIDVKVEGVSMIITHREEFATILQADGMEGLIATLRERLYPEQITENVILPAN